MAVGAKVVKAEGNRAKTRKGREKEKTRGRDDEHKGKPSTSSLYAKRSGYKAAVWLCVDVVYTAASLCSRRFRVHVCLNGLDNEAYPISTTAGLKSTSSS